MSKAFDFLKKRNILEEKEISVTKDEKGNDICFKIRSITSDEFEDIQFKAEKLKSNKTSNIMLSMIALATVEPNFRDSELIKEMGVLTPEEVIKKVLKPGEQSNVFLAIQELSGFTPLEEQIKEAKN